VTDGAPRRGYGFFTHERVDMAITRPSRKRADDVDASQRVPPEIGAMATSTPSRLPDGKATNRQSGETCTSGLERIRSNS
jgi:hypothetical protein